MGEEVTDAIITRRRAQVRSWWAALQSAARWLAVHQRAVVSANAPQRKRDRGEFEVGGVLN